MPILTIIVVIVVVGILLWAINAYVPMQSGVKKLLNVVVIIALIIWLLKVSGALHYLSNLKL